MVDHKPPSLLAAARETLSGLELARLIMAFPVLSVQPKGHGEPVLVLPGLGASDASTFPLRRYLNWLGYDARGWNLGRNTGDVREFLPQVADQVRQLKELAGNPVDIIGWSLGGVIAREVARDYPDAIRQVITMGSPVVGGPKYTSFRRFYERQGLDLEEIEARIAARETRPITVPLTSIYSKLDGIVGWQASIDRHNTHAEHIEVRATHLGLGLSPEVFIIIAGKLANVLRGE